MVAALLKPSVAYPRETVFMAENDNLTLLKRGHNLTMKSNDLLSSGKSLSTWVMMLKLLIKNYHKRSKETVLPGKALKCQSVIDQNVTRYL